MPQLKHLTLKSVVKAFTTIATGAVISLVVIVSGLLSLELFVRKFKPQITYTEAVKRSLGAFAYSDYAPFTLRPNYSEDNFHTNSLGYRGKEFIPDKPAGTFRILALGDSFTLGLGQIQEPWPEVVEKILNQKNNIPFEVINAGFHDGYSPDSYYAYLKAEGLKLNPDLVIIGLYLQNDVGDLRTNEWAKVDENGLPLKVTSRWRKIDNKGRQQDGYPPLAYRYSYLNDSHLWIFFSHWAERHLPSLAFPKEGLVYQADMLRWFDLMYGSCVFKSDCFPAFKQEFDKLLFVLKGTTEMLKSKNIPVLVVFQPSRIQVRTMGEILPDDDIYRLQKLMTDYALNNNLSAEFLDLLPTFLSVNPWEHYYDWETHWNDKGNRLAGEVIAAKLQQMFESHENTNK